jgi:hypothetical protein
MISGWELAGSWLKGPLCGVEAWPLTIRAVLCDLRPRFIEKHGIGRGYRAVARNGRVLLCGDRSLADLTGITASVRLQTWNRKILTGDAPKPYGVLVYVHGRDRLMDGVLFTTQLAPSAEASGDMSLDVGGEWALEFRRSRKSPPKIGTNR